MLTRPTLPGPRPIAPRPVRHGDGGSALAGVIGVMAVTMVVALTVAGASMNALSLTGSTRANVQAQAAADAGIDAAAARIASGACVPSVSQSTTPAFTATVEYAPKANGSNWVSGCPASGAARIRIVSTGRAATPGVAGNSSGDRQTVEATYTVARPNINSGAALYAYRDISLAANSTISAVPGATSLIQSKTGSVACSGDATIEAWSAASIVTGSGGIATSGSCLFRGNMWSAGAASVGGSARIDGDLSSKGSVTWRAGSVSGTVSPYTPSIPPVPNWVDFAYEPAAWGSVSDEPFQVRTLTKDDCRLDSDLLARHSGGTAPVILDARACQKVYTSSSSVMTLTADLVIFANAYEFTSSTNFQADQSRRLWFITPDATGAGPNCPTTSTNPTRMGSFAVSGTFQTDPRVSIMLYTPCAVSLSANTRFRGQIYAESLALTGGSEFTYVPMGLPGVDLSTGTSTSSTTVARNPLGPLLSYRNVVG